MLKLVGVLMVALSAGTVGFGAAAAVRKQTRQLAELLARLGEMKGEMAYRMTPLPALFSQLADNCRTELGDFFAACGKKLSAPPLMSVLVAVSQALEETDGLALDAQARQELLSLCASLGKLDLEGQLSALELTQSRLSRQLELLEAGQNARCRSYGTIGICAGLAMAVILL